MSDLLQVKFKNSAYDSSVSSLFELKAKAPADENAFLQAFRQHYDDNPRPSVLQRDDNHRPEAERNQPDRDEAPRHVDAERQRAEDLQRQDEEARQQVKRRDEKSRRDAADQEEQDAEAAAEQPPEECKDAQDAERETAEDSRADEAEVADEDVKAEAETDKESDTEAQTETNSGKEKLSTQPELAQESQQTDKQATEERAEAPRQAENGKESDTKTTKTKQVKAETNAQKTVAAKAEKALEDDQNTVKEKTVTNSNVAKQAVDKKGTRTAASNRVNEGNVEELSRQTGVRVHSFNIGNNGNKPTEDSNTRAQLLKRLDSKVPTNVKRAMEAVDQQLREASDTIAKPNPSSSKVAKQVVQVAGKALTNAGMHGNKVMISPEINPARAAEGNQFQRMMQMQANGNLSQVRLVNVIQDIMSRMQGLLGGNKEANSSQVSVDFETAGLGRMQLTLQERAGGVEIALQTSTDSSRDQLMNQRDELAQQIREMGFKDVSLDIHSKNDQRDHNRQQARGNEDAENVKLAGNDHADMKQATTGVTG